MSRVILLGASNLTLSFPRLWYGLRNAWPEPVEVFAAHGHGRSFGDWSRIGPRELPGILPCRLWDELSAQPPSNEPPRALITDIGNDVLYGVELEQIAEWVGACLERLAAVRARVVLTQLPVASALSLSRSRFHFFRRLFFPGSRMRFEDLKPTVLRLNQLIMDVGRKHGATTLELPGRWYGADPIHIQAKHRAAAWQELLSSWFEPSESVSLENPGAARALRIWRQRPLERRWHKQTQHVKQPTLSEADGATLRLF